MSDHPSLTRGIHHLGLTVRHLDEVRDFLVGALGFRVVGENAGYPAVFLSDGTATLTLWRAEDPATAAGFDRRRQLGLHHLALAVDDIEQAFKAVAKWPAVEVEFEPHAAAHRVCRTPCNRPDARRSASGTVRRSLSEIPWRTPC